MINRDKYLHKLIENRDHVFSKIITGHRFTGKSLLITEICIIVINDALFLRKHVLAEKNWLFHPKKTGLILE